MSVRLLVVGITMQDVSVGAHTCSGLYWAGCEFP